MFKEKERPYRISYSAITTFLKSPELYHYQYILGNFDPPTEAFMTGSVVDCLALEEDKFDSQFAVLDGEEKPSSPQEKSFIIDIIKAEINGVNVDEELLLKIGKEYYSQGKKKEEKFIEELVGRYEKLAAYVSCAHQLLPERGKYKRDLDEKLSVTLPYIISPTTYNHARAIVASLKSYDVIYKLLWEGEGYNQIEIVRKPSYIDQEDNAIVKVILDRLRINHKKKTIYIIDLKTTKAENGPSFEQSVKSYGYKIQMGIYGDIVQLWAEEQGMGDYKIKYLWVVAAKSKPFPCFVVEAKDNHLEESRVLYVRTIKEMIECKKTDNWKQQKVWTLSE